MILAGVLAIVAPLLSGLAATLLVAWLLEFCGVAHLIYCWHRRGAGGVLLDFLVGLLYLAVGIYILVHPMAGLASLTVVLAFYLFIEAILEFILAFNLGKIRGSGWLWVDGVVNLVLAAMIWKTWPVSAAWVIGTLLGIGILFTAFARLMLSLEAKRLAKEAAAPASS